MPIKGGYLLVAGAGGVIAWSGLRGKSWSTVLQDLIRGQSPQSAQTVNQILGASGTGSGGSGTGVTGNESEIVGAIRSIMGKFHYVFGGVPKNGVVDCSSLMNEGIGDVLDLPIPLFPAGKYRGQTHGPTTVMWRVWRGAVTVPASQAQPGDLVIWLSHMGVVTDNGQHMISALNPSMGIRETPIAGFGPAGQPHIFRRLKVLQ